MSKYTFVSSNGREWAAVETFYNKSIK